MARRARWLIEGTLQVETQLHLGTGSETHRDGLFAERPDEARERGAEPRQAEVSAVAIDAQKRAFLPGSSIKGALRSWLSQARPLFASGEPAALAIEQLFGSEDAPALEERKLPIYGGKVAFWNAFLEPQRGWTPKVPFWDENRSTGIRACVSLSRPTKTAANERLFFEEVVPAGVRFTLRIALEHPSDEEIRLVLFTLDAFNRPGRRASLGAGGADGDGLFSWTPGTIRRLRLDEPGEVERWLAQTPPPAGFEGLPELSKVERADLVREALAAFSIPAPAELEVGIRVHFDGPFLIAAPAPEPTQEERDEAKRTGDFLPDRVPVTDSRGRPVLPASSLRGALRSRAEAILRTLGQPACDPSGPSACPQVQKLSQVRGLCPACRLFGAPGWGTAMEIDPFTSVSSNSELFPQEHVAIDRFTGGGAEHLKFNTKSWNGGAFAGALRLDLERSYPDVGRPVPAIGAAEIGLLALVLRDFAEGDITLGAGAAQGYGACRATIESVKLGAGVPPQALFQNVPEALRRTLEGGLQVANGTEVTPEISAALEAAVAALHAGSNLPASLAALPTPTKVPAPLPPAGTARPDQFHNPYHFVPLPLNSPVEPPPGPITHDRLAQGRSGRIVFRVTTRGPVVVGAHRHQENPEAVHIVGPFELDGQPALPGSSLRGLLSSLAEAASGSALRILGDRPLSVRAPMDESLGAIGILEQGSSGLVVRPLTLPHLPWNAGRKTADYPLRWQRLFVDQPTLRVYVDGYGKVVKGEQTKLEAHGFLASRPESNGSARREHWFMKLPAAPRRAGNEIEVDGAHPNKKENLVLAQNAIDRRPIDQTDYDQLSATEQAAYTPGLLRVLGIEGRESEMPTTKKHEIFLPLPKGWDARGVLEAQKALDQFHRLADDRTAADPTLPFELAGTPREPKGGIRLRAGDLVCFTPDRSGTKVEELAISSIWRTGRGRLSEYLAKELLPLNPQRQTLTLAEQLFGYVEQGLIPTEPKRPARALASRVRVSFARLEGKPEEPWYDPKRTLQILSSPKPPSPALYFRERKGETAPKLKRELQAKRHAIQGRKMYLHHRNPQPWVPEGASDDKLNKQRSRVQPLREDLSFVGHLDFDNLTEQELGLLLYALRPTAAFRHKLGLGKPLGLGTVEIAPLGLFLVDRAIRYGREGDLLTAPRYHAAVLAETFPSTLEALYSAEAIAALGLAADPASVFALRETFRGTMETEIRQAIELLGDPAAVVAPVHYPRTEMQQPGDQKGYEWFVRNEEKSKFAAQRLAPIAAEHVAARRLPLLSTRHEAAGRNDARPREQQPQGRPPHSGNPRPGDRGANPRSAAPPPAAASAPREVGRLGGAIRWAEPRTKKPKS